MDEVVDSLNASNINPVTSNGLISSITFALIILLIGFALGKLIGTALFKLLRGIDFDKNVKIIHKSVFRAKVISLIVSWSIYFLTTIIALMTLGILNIALLIIGYFIALIVLGTLILGFVFAFPNLVAGINIKKKKLFKKDDFISVKGVKGIIIKIGYFNTRIKGKNEELFFVPNKLIKNYKKA